MRILEVTQRFPPAIGGVERHVDSLARQLHAAGHSIEVVTTDLQRDRPFARLEGVPSDEPLRVRRHAACRTLPFPHGLGIVSPGMLLNVLDAGVDVVHAHALGYFPTWAGALRRAARREPLVITTHSDAGGGTSGSALFHRAVARATLQAADRIVALTRLERDWLTSLGVDPSRIEVIPNGIDLADFPEPPNRVSDPAAFRLLYVGRLYPEQKGLLPLVRAVGALAPRYKLELRLVGEDWGGLDPVRALARQLGLSDRVTATGALPRPQVLQEYARADLFVLPSLFEPFGIVLLEAMASGLPIVASEVGGVPEVLGDGEAGLLVPPGDPRALAGAVAQLLDDGERRRSIGRAGRRRASLFDWSRLAPRFLRLFEGLVA